MRVGILPFLISLIFPACGYPGAEGIAIPAPLDTTHIVRPATPNTALAAPEGFSPTPDLITHRYTVDPDTLYATIAAVAAAQPRTYPQIHYDAQRQAHYVVRSALWNFPDLVTIQVTPDGAVILWSRSIYGQSDLGVNKARLAVWLAAIDAKLAVR